VITSFFDSRNDSVIVFEGIKDFAMVRREFHGPPIELIASAVRMSVVAAMPYMSSIRRYSFISYPPCLPTPKSGLDQY
jgi:hypothetical protein